MRIEKLFHIKKKNPKHIYQKILYSNQGEKAWDISWAQTLTINTYTWDICCLVVNLFTLDSLSLCFAELISAAVA